MLGDPELTRGLEPLTPCLQGRCSTIELRQQNMWHMRSALQEGPFTGERTLDCTKGFPPSVPHPTMRDMLVDHPRLDTPAFFLGVGCPVPFKSTMDP